MGIIRRLQCFLTRGGILVQLMKKYTGLEGILPCPEDHYIRPYMYDSARLERNETFDISEENYCLCQLKSGPVE